MSRKRSSRNFTRKSRRVRHIVSITPAEDQLLAKTIARTSPINASDDSAVSVLRHFRRKSYSPTINQKLKLIGESDHGSDVHIFGCHEFQKLMNSPTPLVSVNGRQRTMCLSPRDPIASAQLIQRVFTTIPDPDVLIPPRQIQSNCWFNTMFVTFFVSDKGVKFFRYFRKIMITGKKANGQQIPDELWNAFINLNYSIESCYIGGKYAYAVNTNQSIRSIHNAIVSDNPLYKNRLPLPGYKESNKGDGILYYEDIMTYLDDSEVHTYRYECDRANYKDVLLERLNNISRKPHIVIVFKDSHVTDVRHTKTFVADGVTYKCDSIILSDTDVQHAICLITCRRRGYAFDGQSYSRLVPLRWLPDADDAVIAFDDFTFLRKKGAPVHSLKRGVHWVLYFRSS